MSFNRIIGKPDTSPETDNEYRDANGYYHVCYLGESGDYSFYTCYGLENAKAIAEEMTSPVPIMGTAWVMTRNDWEWLIANLPKDEAPKADGLYAVWAASPDRAKDFGKAACVIPGIRDQFAYVLCRYYSPRPHEEVLNKVYDEYAVRTN